MRDLLIKWLNEGMALQTGEELYIPSDNAVSQKDFYNAIRKELNILRNINTVEAAKLRIFNTYKDGKFWTVVKKISITPLVAFKKNSDGVVSRVEIVNEKDKLKRQKLMEAQND